MLARSFLSATDLGIQEDEKAVLIKILGMLERGELVATDARCPTVRNGFNMARVRVETECGTACCIMGWGRIIGGADLFDIAGIRGTGRRYYDELLRLFMYDDERRHRV